MGQNAGEKKGGFWKRLVKDVPQPDDAPREQQDTPLPAEPSAQAVGAVLPAEEGEQHPRIWAVKVEEDSALWQLWDRARPQSRPPSLVLCTDREGEHVPLTEEELEREEERLLEPLERWAKAHLDKLDVGQFADPPSLDSDYFIHISATKMAAWALAVPPFGAEGAGPALGKLGEALVTAGVKAGLDEANVGWLAHSEGNWFQLRLVARGVPPLEGKDGELVEHFARQVVRKVEMDEQGNVDYRAQCYFQAVCKGDVICDIIPPKPGISGQRVTGERIEPRAVTPAQPRKGSNIDLSKDGTQLLAAMDGHVEFQGGVFQVRPTLLVQGDVDYSTGNIIFRGDVHITGDIRENFRVRATGKITIDGLVEGATVEADGDIVISKGVLGNNKALIKSKKLVRAKYLENCVVYSGDCTYADCIINSQIFSDSKISVTTGRGTVIGGCLTAADQIECSVIGSQSGRQTEVVLGQLPYIQEELRDNEMSLQSIREECEELDKILATLAGRQGTDEEEKELSRARLRRSVLALKEDKLLRRQEELHTVHVELGKCRLSCGTLFPVTKVTIGVTCRSVEDQWKRCTIRYDLDSREVVIS